MSDKLNGIMASTKPLITFLIDDELLARLDDFRFGHRLASRGEAIRYLLEAALDQNPTPDPLRDTGPRVGRPGRQQKPLLPTVPENTERVNAARRRKS